MQEYSRIGSDILGQHNDDLLSAAAIVALQHHEKWNGKGYPKGLSKNDIHIYARTCAITDVFDALTSKRPYKDAGKLIKQLILLKKKKEIILIHWL